MTVEKKKGPRVASAAWGRRQKAWTLAELNSSRDVRLSDVIAKSP